MKNAFKYVYGKRQVLMIEHSGGGRTIQFFLGLTLFTLFLEPLTELTARFTDALTLFTTLNYILAVGLFLGGGVAAYASFNLKRVEKITALFLTYLLSTFSMGGLYYLVHISHSNCFTFRADGAVTVSVIDFIYFSFVTVSTLGFGDIYVNHTLVRLLVIGQIMFGSFLILQTASEMRSNRHTVPLKKAE